MSSKKEYPIVKSLPVAKFYYQGSHTHPVRRTVLVTEVTPTTLCGYEMREGAITRAFSEAPIKSYARNKIAKVGQCGKRLRKRTPANLHAKSTLTRLTLVDFVKQGA
jgi:hypothetical protein